MPPSCPKEVIRAYRPPLTVFNSMPLSYCARFHTRSDRPGSKLRLKRCSGCAEVVYCSKDCQKVDWPRHKGRCTWVAEFSRTAIAPDDSESGVAFREAFGRLGLSSERHLGQLVDDYAEVHDWELYALVKALLYKNTKLGHTHWDALAQPDKAALMVLKLNPALAGPDPERVGPARAFLLQSHALVDFPSIAAADGRWSAELRKSWAVTVRERATLVKYYQRPHHPDFVGPRPVCCLVEDTGFTRWTFIPLCRGPRPRRPMSDATSCAVRCGVITLCVETTRAGFPIGALGLSSLSPTARTLPPGRFLRIRGVWRWRPLFDSWADYRPGEHGEFDKVMEKLGPEFVANPARMEYMIELFRQIPPRWAHE